MINSDIDETNYPEPSDSFRQYDHPFPPICGQRFEEVLKNKTPRLSYSEVAEGAEVSRNTISKIRENTPVRESCIQKLLVFLDIPRAAIELQASQRQQGGFKFDPPVGWEISDVLTPFIETSNGVSYKIFKLQNSVTKSKFARGKLYDLSHIPFAEREDRRKYLLRHSEVCDLASTKRIDPRNRLAWNLDVKAFDNNCAWWVIDKWIEGEPLSKFVPKIDESWSISQISHLGSEILEAIAVLHSLKVIMRELTPERIYYDGSNVTLTDFELARLVDSGISVRGDWCNSSAYRAPEVSSNKAFESSDIFSWGIVMRFVLTGNPLPTATTTVELRKYPGIENFLDSCVHDNITKRPSSAKNALQGWKEITSRFAS